MSSEEVATADDAPAEEAPSTEDAPKVEEAPKAAGAELDVPSIHSHEVKIAAPDPSQFAEPKPDHAGEYIKHARSASTSSKVHLTVSKTTASFSRMSSPPSKAGILQLSPSKAGMHPTPSKELSFSKGTPSKHEIEADPAAGEAAETFGSAPKDHGNLLSPTRQPSISRRGSHMTSEDRLGRRHSDRRSSSVRAHGTLTGSIISFRRASGEVERAKIPRMQNTYRLESKRPFNTDCVAIILKEVLSKECETERYDASKSPRFAMALTSEIRARIKLQHFDRYKIIVYVSVCEKQQQSVNSSLRFLWDSERDNFTTYSYENPTMFVVATAFGVYYE